MAEYSTEFSDNLIQAAELLSGNADESFDKRRTILYLCLLSSEISLKAVLERAGVPLKDIVALSHRLDALMHKVGECEVPYPDSTLPAKWIPATSINSKSFKVDSAIMTVGQFLTVDGASKYPTEVRYGDKVVHYPVNAALLAAKTILTWAKENSGQVRLSKKSHS